MTHSHQKVVSENSTPDFLFSYKNLNTMSLNFRIFLDFWSLKTTEKEPLYEIAELIDHNQFPTFMCTVTVENILYIGMGCDKLLEHSILEAAADLVTYLIVSNVIKTTDIPVDLKSKLDKRTNSKLIKIEFNNHLPPQRQKNGSNCKRMPNLSHITADKTEDTAMMNESLVDRICIPGLMKDKSENIFAEYFDEFDGGWSNVDIRQILYQHKGSHALLEYTYDYGSVSSTNQSNIFCQLSVQLPDSNSTFNVKKFGSNKAIASKTCTKSLITLLYRNGSLPPFKKQAKPDPTMVPLVRVDVPSGVQARLEALVTTLGLSVPPKTPNCVLSPSIQIIGEPQPPPQLNQPIHWSPPSPNWDPWRACPIISGSVPQEATRSTKPRMCRLTIQRDEIVQAVLSHQIVLIRGETGSGKTTQVPQFILDHFISSGNGADCNIIVTQPRRISAITLAERVSQERCEVLGQSCGYSVRFDTVLPQPYGGILYCTVGSLLRKMEGGLRGVSHVIVDEIHERDCNTDFLMILLKDMARSYPNMRVILMSATVDTNLFQNFFPNLYTVEIEASVYPVKRFFLEDVIQETDFSPKLSYENSTLTESTGLLDSCIYSPNLPRGPDCNQICADTYSLQIRMAMAYLPEEKINFEIMIALLQHIEINHGAGAVLVFLPSRTEIEHLLGLLGSHPLFGNERRYHLVPVHTQTGWTELQQSVYSAPTVGYARMIVLASDVAESSVCVPGVRFVVDSCRTLADQSENTFDQGGSVWASRTKLTRRRRCAGRVEGGGIVYQLCSRARYEDLEAEETPQLDLEESVLLARLLGQGNGVLARTVHAPRHEALVRAEASLCSMLVLDETGTRLTPLGRVLARLPLTPRLGKMVLLAAVLGQARTGCELACSGNRKQAARLEEMLLQVGIPVSSLTTSRDMSPMLAAGMYPRLGCRVSPTSLLLPSGLLAHLPQSPPLCVIPQSVASGRHLIPLRPTPLHPLQLLLFASSSVVWIHDDCLLLDSWLAFSGLTYDLAFSVRMLAAAIDHLLLRVCEDPVSVLTQSLDTLDQQVMDVALQLCTADLSPPSVDSIVIKPGNKRSHSQTAPADNLLLPPPPKKQQHKSAFCSNAKRRSQPVSPRIGQNGVKPIPKLPQKCTYTLSACSAVKPVLGTHSKWDVFRTTRPAGIAPQYENATKYPNPKKEEDLYIKSAFVKGRSEYRVQNGHCLVADRGRILTQKPSATSNSRNYDIPKSQSNFELIRGDFLHTRRSFLHKIDCKNRRKPENSNETGARSSCYEHMYPKRENPEEIRDRPKRYPTSRMSKSHFYTIHLFDINFFRTSDSSQL